MVKTVRSLRWSALRNGILIGILQWCFVSFWFSIVIEPLHLALSLALGVALPTIVLASYCYYQASRYHSLYNLHLLNTILTILSIIVVGMTAYQKLVGLPDWLFFNPLVSQSLQLSAQLQLGLLFGTLGYTIILAFVILTKRLQRLRHM